MSFISTLILGMEFVHQFHRQGEYLLKKTLLPVSCQSITRSIFIAFVGRVLHSRRLPQTVFDPFQDYSKAVGKSYFEQYVT